MKHSIPEYIEPKILLYKFFPSAPQSNPVACIWENENAIDEPRSLHSLILSGRVGRSVLNLINKRYGNNTSGLLQMVEEEEDVVPWIQE